ncbi:MAG: DUF4296 domain-containing protein [Phocaeicola sp.]
MISYRINGRTMRYMIGCIGALLLLLLTACSDTEKKPKGFLEPEKMEAVLYDYHLGLSMSSNLPYAENYKKESYRNYLFEKHQVTAAQFDSSMVWYMRHTKELTQIYSNLTEQFKEQRATLQELVALRDNTFKGSFEGDTIDIWHGSKLHWLTDHPLTNKVVFEMAADSNFRAKDAFLWEADLLFLEPNNQELVVGLNILLANDSVIGETRTFTASNKLELYLKADSDSAYSIKQLNGFIYYTDRTDKKVGVFVNNLILTRYHDLTHTPTPSAVEESESNKELSPNEKDSLVEVARKSVEEAYPTEVLAPTPDTPQLVAPNK